MIEFQNVQIELEGFKILPIHDYFDLTTAISAYEYSPSDGGINLNVQISKIDNISEGYFYCTQICNNHKLKISTINSNYLFDSFGETFKDTPNQNSCHFKTYPIKNNVIQYLLGNKIEIFDAPFIELFPWWTAVEYHIEFETWLQYSKSEIINNDIQPILKLNWNLYCQTHQENNEWIIDSSKLSTNEDIFKSVHYFDLGDEPLIPCKLKHLGQTVDEFRSEHKAELLKPIN